MDWFFTIYVTGLFALSLTLWVFSKRHLDNARTILKDATDSLDASQDALTAAKELNTRAVLSSFAGAGGTVTRRNNQTTSSARR